MCKAYGEDSSEHRQALAALDALNANDWPESLDYLHQILFAIRRFLGNSMNGTPRITWVEIDAWERHADYQLDERELDALAKMDAAYCFPDSG